MKITKLFIKISFNPILNWVGKNSPHLPTTSFLTGIASIVGNIFTRNFH